MYNLPKSLKIYSSVKLFIFSECKKPSFHDNRFTYFGELFIQTFLLLLALFFGYNEKARKQMCLFK